MQGNVKSLNQKVGTILLPYHAAEGAKSLSIPRVGTERTAESCVSVTRAALSASTRSFRQAIAKRVEQKPAMQAFLLSGRWGRGSGPTRVQRLCGAATA